MVRVAVQLTGLLHDFVWGTTVYYMHVASRSTSDLGFDGVDDLLVDRTESACNIGNLQLSLSGPAASLPAGPVIANFKFGLQYQGFDTRDAEPGAAPTANGLVIPSVLSQKVAAAPSAPLRRRQHNHSTRKQT